MSSAQGRFTSPDSPFADQFVDDPQSWNLYAYVRNNPLKLVDVDGNAAAWAVDAQRWMQQQVGPATSVHPNLGTAVKVGAVVAGVAVVATDVDWKGVADRAVAWSGSFAPMTGGHFGIAGDGGFTQIVMNENTSAARPGTLGKPDHQQTVKEEAERINGRPEVPIPTPGGKKEGRRADAVGTNPQTGAPEIVQVYRPTKGGNIPKRERDAAADIGRATGVRPTMVPVRPLKPPPPKPKPEE